MASACSLLPLPIRWRCGDDEAKHGVFTKHLLEALYGAADGEGFGNGDNVITLTEAKAYLDVNMTRAARRIGREQDPSMDGNGALVLAAFGPDGPPAAVVAALDEVLDVEMFALANVNVRAGPTAQTEKLVTISNGDSAALANGGLVVAGYTGLGGAGGDEVWLIRFDSAGAPVWERTFGGGKDDGANAVVILDDGGLAVAGFSESTGAGGKDFWVLRIAGAEEPTVVGAR